MGALARGPGMYPGVIVDLSPNGSLPPALDHEWVDSSRSPLFVTRWPSETTVGAIDGYFDAVDAWVMRIHSPWCTVLDFSALQFGASSPATRKRFADRARPLQPLLQEHCVAIALLAPTPMVRGVVTAVMWFVPAPVPVEVFVSEDEAHAWLRWKIGDAEGGDLAGVAE